MEAYATQTTPSLQATMRGFRDIKRYEKAVGHGKSVNAR